MLAEKLGMTVTDMRANMPGDEYLGWSVYYGRKAQRMQLARMEGGARG